MSVRTAAAFLLAATILPTACASGHLDERTSTPARTSGPPTSPSSVQSATPDIPYPELARRAGFLQFQDSESLPGTTFSFWIPEPYEATPGRWESGEFLAVASRAIDDYAYEIYADNTLYAGTNTRYYYGSPDADACARLTRKADVGQVDFAVRTGQDPQLDGMAIANYGGLLAIAIQGMDGEHPGYPQSSEAFTAPGFEAWRIISPFDLPEYEGRRNNITYIDYILKDADRIWVLTFSVDTHLFWEEDACAYLLGEFDLIARTFGVSSS